MPKQIAVCCLAILIALYVVGAVSHGVLRHIVQTLPLWLPIVWGFRGNSLAKWSALPCLAIWFALMTLIWLFLLGWARVITGTFSPTEIAMTIVVGAASLAAFVAGLRQRTPESPLKAVSVTIVFLALQLIALRVSFLPGIAHD